MVEVCYTSLAMSYIYLNLRQPHFCSALDRRKRVCSEMGSGQSPDEGREAPEESAQAPSQAPAQAPAQIHHQAPASLLALAQNHCHQHFSYWSQGLTNWPPRHLSTNLQRRLPKKTTSTHQERGYTSFFRWPYGGTCVDGLIWRLLYKDT
jgi:hypothetical protein